MNRSRHDKLKGALLGLAVVALVGLALNLKSTGDSSERAEGPPRGEEEMPDQTDCDFSKVPEHAAMQDPCSPAIDELDFEWRGIKINMPDRAELSGQDTAEPGRTERRVHVYILLQVTLRQAMQYPFEREGISLSFVDRDTGATFTSRLTERNPGLPMERAKLSREEIEGSVMRYYYNIDALEFVDLPNTAATYDVHATFDEFQSNAMAITIE